MAAKSATTPREKLERTAYALFTRHGIRAVGVDLVVARSGISKMTLYRHFPSKDALALAYLDRRWELFSRRWQQAIEDRRPRPREALLQVFDAMNAWFRSPGFNSCPVVKALLETGGRRGEVRAGVQRYFARVRGFFHRLAVAAGARDPDALAAHWQFLCWGAIVGASSGDLEAAARAKSAGRTLLSAALDRRTSRAGTASGPA